MLKVENWYSFEEALGIAVGDMDNVAHKFFAGTYNIETVAEDGFGYNDMEKVCKNLFTESGGSYSANAGINDFLLHLIMRYGKYYVYHIDTAEPTAVEESSANKDWLTLFFHMLDVTAPKYTKILSIYKDNENKLMDKLTNASQTVNRFNDTPQDGGLFDDDSHTTSVNQIDSSAETDVATVMARLKEIQDSYENVLLLWSNEFYRLFIKEEQLR